MAFNWITEAYKWKVLIKNLEHITLLKSLKAILAGVTVSIFTPNRIGEFAGRIFVLKRENRIPSIFSTITGSISQLIITVVIGIISSIILTLNYYNINFISVSNFKIFIILLFIITIIITYIYFNIKVLYKLISVIPYMKKFKKYLFILSSYKVTDLLYVLFISLIRYIIFVFQFYLMLYFFNIHIGLFNSFISIAVTYIILAIIPTVSLTEIGVRGSVAIAIIGIFSNDVLGIAFSSILIWIINLAIPAIIGSIFFYKSKF